jgi:hypothetical protein
MEFKHVIRICLEFSIANGGTIASCPPTEERLEVHSRTTRTEIRVERDDTKTGSWRLKQKQNALGEKTSMKETVATEEHLLNCLSRFWDIGDVGESIQHFDGA